MAHVAARKADQTARPAAELWEMRLDRGGSDMTSFNRPNRSVVHFYKKALYCGGKMFAVEKRNPLVPWKAKSGDKPPINWCIPERPPRGHFWGSPPPPAALPRAWDLGEVGASVCASRCGGVVGPPPAEGPTTPPPPVSAHFSPLPRP